MQEASGAMARVPGQRRSGTTNDGVRLSVIETGAGPPFVILPAWTNSAAEYHGQVREFGRDHRVLAIDMRAHGEAEQTEHGHRVSRYAADLHDILTALKVKDAVLM